MSKALYVADLMEQNFELGRKYGYEYFLSTFELRKDPEYFDTFCEKLLDMVIEDYNKIKTKE